MTFKTKLNCNIKKSYEYFKNGLGDWLQKLVALAVVDSISTYGDFLVIRQLCKFFFLISFKYPVFNYWVSQFGCWYLSLTGIEDCFPNGGEECKLFIYLVYIYIVPIYLFVSGWGLRKTGMFGTSLGRCMAYVQQWTTIDCEAN